MDSGIKTAIGLLFGLVILPAICACIYLFYKYMPDHGDNDVYSNHIDRTTRRQLFHESLSLGRSWVMDSRNILPTTDTRLRRKDGSRHEANYELESVQMTSNPESVSVQAAMPILANLNHSIPHTRSQNELVDQRNAQKMTINPNISGHPGTYGSIIPPPCYPTPVPYPVPYPIYYPPIGSHQLDDVTWSDEGDPYPYGFDPDIDCADSLYSTEWDQPENSRNGRWNRSLSIYREPMKHTKPKRKYHEQQRRYGKDRILRDGMGSPSPEAGFRANDYPFGKRSDGDRAMRDYGVRRRNDSPFYRRTGHPRSFVRDGQTEPDRKHDSRNINSTGGNNSTDQPSRIQLNSLTRELAREGTPNVERPLRGSDESSVNPSSILKTGLGPNKQEKAEKHVSFCDQQALFNYRPPYVEDVDDEAFLPGSHNSCETTRELSLSK